MERFMRACCTAGLILLVLKLEAKEGLPGKTSGQQADDLRQEAKQAAVLIRRLSPDEFPELPSNVRHQLTNMGCKIPSAPLQERSRT
jgi:hypothetical protein